MLDRPASSGLQDSHFRFAGWSSCRPSISCRQNAIGSHFFDHFLKLKIPPCPPSKIWTSCPRPPPNSRFTFKESVRCRPVCFHMPVVALSLFCSRHSFPLSSRKLATPPPTNPTKRCAAKSRNIIPSWKSSISICIKIRSFHFRKSKLRRV